ncbi:hypothetical protein AQJ91_37975 [Streptomyces dysideae]|uniref:Major facilitator superfamily (MFS) profile domain-containing protein n=1 Tax=Streptomyces dysideae TaxID=909626 RepID=A0A101USE9_9ACTN|nr:hypothetical protein AQJ91_37975 [Streptomyces dysideae]
MWRQRDFGIFWAAQTLSVLGDSFALIALPLLVLQATGSLARMGLLTAVGGAASVLAAVFAGAVVDRVDQMHAKWRRPARRRRSAGNPAGMLSRALVIMGR